MISSLSIYKDRLINAVFTHLYYVAVSVTIAFVIALLLGILFSRAPKWANIILPILSIFHTIPGIVFIGVLFIYLGMAPRTVLIALTVYAIFPMLKNTYVGIVEVSEQYREVARGCGMSGFQMLCRVELPLALPAIITGLRMAAVYTVSWAVLSAMIGLGGLGEFIYAGVTSNNNFLIIIGAIPAAVIAVVLSQLINALYKKLIPKPLRRDLK